MPDTSDRVVGSGEGRSIGREHHGIDIPNVLEVVLDTFVPCLALTANRIAGGIADNGHCGRVITAPTADPTPRRLLTGR